MSARYPLVRNSYARATRLGVSRSPSRFGSSPSSARSFLISSCIVLFYIPLLAQSADALYADRENTASALKAEAAWQEQLAQNPRAFDAAWKLARAEYWLGGHVPESERRTHLEHGIEAGRAAIAMEPNKPEGYFWM